MTNRKRDYGVWTTFRKQLAKHPEECEKWKAFQFGVESHPSIEGRPEFDKWVSTLTLIIRNQKTIKTRRWIVHNFVALVTKSLETTEEWERVVSRFIRSPYVRTFLWALMKVLKSPDVAGNLPRVHFLIAPVFAFTHVRAGPDEDIQQMRRIVVRFFEKVGDSVDTVLGDSADAKTFSWTLAYGLFNAMRHGPVQDMREGDQTWSKFHDFAANAGRDSHESFVLRPDERFTRQEEQLMMPWPPEVPSDDEGD
jgi:hypothetical protein